MVSLPRETANLLMVSGRQSSGAVVSPGWRLLKAADFPSPSLTGQDVCPSVTSQWMIPPAAAVLLLHVRDRVRSASTRNAGMELRRVRR